MELNFDLDAYSLGTHATICPPLPAHDPGILFSFDDGDPGAGTGAPDNATEVFIYDRCGMYGNA